MVTNISVMSGVLQAYAWGRVDGLAQWAPDAALGPQAELWFGAHPNGTSVIVTGDEIAAHAAPVLVKILAAGSPLSLQVHPNEQAITELLETPETAQLLADRGVKSEVLIALEEFHVLAGLRPKNEAADLLALGLSAPEHISVVDALRAGDYIAAIREVLITGLKVDADAMLAALPQSERVVMQRVVAKYPDDIGLAVAFMMQPRSLQAGEAMFVRAGCLHAYVDGLGVEVMTSSDNVLRLGLTPKHIAIEASLASLEPTLQPIVVADCLNEASIAGIPFSVQRVQSGEVRIAKAGAIALCVSGSATSAAAGVALHAGLAAFVHEGELTLAIEGETFIARPL